MNSDSNKQLASFLQELDIVTPQAITDSLAKAEKKHLPLEEVLIDSDLVSRKMLGKVIADFLQQPSIYLADTAIDVTDLKLLPEEYSKEQLAVVFKQDPKTLHVASNAFSHEKIVEAIKKKTGLAVKIYFATKRDIEDTLAKYNKNAGAVFATMIKEHVEKAQTTTGVEPPIIELVATIITYAYQNKASDIHIEPTEEYTLVRFRIDGVLHDIAQLPSNLHDAIITRIKVLSNLRTDEHQNTQDGKINFKTERDELDLRVSIVPITNGENVVMRLLSEHSHQSSLAELGLSSSDLKKLQQAYQKPHGMILSTGPTGSGKTTTLYSILKVLNQRKINIMTIEDPVEYDIENINQIQVNEKTNLTFAKGLRSIVRQDPDIILVGEVRDSETANIAVNAAMTGHLVLSTLHTNDAATTFPRLTDMEVEAYLVASSVNVVIGQRLVRRICMNCKVSTKVSLEHVGTEIKKKFGDKETANVYKGKGCTVCHLTGYKDRVGIFEVMLVDEEIHAAITKKQSADEIKQLAITKGMKTMLEDGVEKIQQGITTLEEIMRATTE